MMTRRSTGKTRIARALWYAGRAWWSCAPRPCRRPQPGEARVRTLFSGISRGTERLVFNGAVGRSEWERMRGPKQEGAFPFPVKYGYCATGVVEEGPGELVGPDGVLPASAPGLFQRAGRPPGAGAGRRAGAARDAGRQHGDGAQRPVGQRRRAGRPHRGGGRRRGGAAGGLAGRAAAGRRGDGGGCGRRPRGRSWRPWAPVCAARARRRGEADVVFHASATRGRPRHRHRLRRVGGHHRRDELVRRQAGAGRPRRRLPQPPPEARLLAGRPGLAEPPPALGLSPPHARPPLRLLALPALDALVAEEIAFEDAPRELPRILGAGRAAASPPSSAIPRPDRAGEPACTPSRCATGS